MDCYRDKRYVGTVAVHSGDRVYEISVHGNEKRPNGFDSFVKPFAIER
jgi:hypothetical protein